MNFLKRIFRKKDILVKKDVVKKEPIYELDENGKRIIESLTFEFRYYVLPGNYEFTLYESIGIPKPDVYDIPILSYHIKDITDEFANDEGIIDFNDTDTLNKVLQYIHKRCYIVPIEYLICITKCKYKE